MQDINLELMIGDAVQIDDVIYTVIDIENGAVSFRIDFTDSWDESSTSPHRGRLAK